MCKGLVWFGSLLCLGVMGRVGVDWVRRAKGKRKRGEKEIGEKEEERERGNTRDDYPCDHGPIGNLYYTWMLVARA